MSEFDDQPCKCIACDPNQGYKRGELAFDLSKDPNRQSMVSERRTPWAVNCRKHGQVFLTHHEYNRQMSRPDSRWSCPRCGEVCGWDDDNYEAWINSLPSDEEMEAAIASTDEHATGQPDANRDPNPE